MTPLSSYLQRHFELASRDECGAGAGARTIFGGDVDACPDGSNDNCGMDDCGIDGGRV